MVCHQKHLGKINYLAALEYLDIDNVFEELAERVTFNMLASLWSVFPDLYQAYDTKAASFA